MNTHSVGFPKILTFEPRCITAGWDQDRVPLRSRNRVRSTFASDDACPGMKESSSAVSRNSSIRIHEYQTGDTA